MQVSERMSKPVITALPDMPIQEALNLMREKGIHRLPVVDSDGKLKGIVSDRDLLHASPSDATSLSVWELNYLLSKVVMKDVMTKSVITVEGDSRIRETARIMVEKKIHGLPVMDGENVVGIITETDLFKVLLDLLET
jgi:acetoin utilization protein AcuB